MTSRIGIAVLGLGRQGHSQIQGLLAACGERIELRCVADRNVEETTQKLSEVLPADSMPAITTPWYLEGACKTHRVDAVLVCSPQATVNMIRRSLHNGLAVWCDHPISLQNAAVLACFEKAKSSGNLLQFTSLRRFDPTLISIKKRIRQGDIGHVTNVRLTTSHQIPQLEGATGSIFRDCVSGEVDAVSWLIGLPPTSVYASPGGMPGLLAGAATPENDEAVSIQLRFLGGTLATMEIQRTMFPENETLEVRGTEGVLMVDPSHPTGTVLHSVTRHGTDTSLVGGTQEEREEDAFVSAVEHFIDVLQGKAESELSDVDALRASNMAQACQESHQRNAAVAKVSQPLARAEVLLNEPLWIEDPNTMSV